MLSPLRLLSPLLLALVWSASTGLQALDFSDLEAAEIELRQLSADWRSAFEAEPSDESGQNLGLTLQALGIVERQAGKAEEALATLTEACDLLARYAPNQRPDALEAKALTLQDLGDLEQSEMLLREILEFRINANRTQIDPPLAATLDHLALNLLYQARYPEVRPLLDRALEHTDPKNPASVAKILDHRGRLLHTLGSHTRAIDTFKKALALNFEDPKLELTLRSQIALAQLRMGKLDEAEQGTYEVRERALALFADNPVQAVPYINNLGELSLSLGRPEEAKAAFEESLAFLESDLGERHPSLIGVLNNLGVSEQSIGDYAAAQVHLERAAGLQSEHLPPIHLRVAETLRNLARNALLAELPNAREQIKNATLVGLELLDQLIKEGSENERLNFLERFELLSLPCATGDPELIANVLLASKARLLDAMLDEQQEVTPPTWQELQASLKPGTAFVDTCRYFTTSMPAEEQYGAVLILPSGTPRWIPLGSAEELRAWLENFRKRLRWRSAEAAGSDAGRPPPLRLKGILKALHRGFWRPVADQIPQEIRHLAYSPAGSLHFMPLVALLDEEGQLANQRFLQVTTVSSGRDLLSEPAKIGLSDAPWSVFTISEFPNSAQADWQDPLLSLLADLQPMPGTREEAARLRTVAPSDSQFVHGKQATEQQLGKLSFTPSVLHFGCHAFFLDDSEAENGGPVDFDERSNLLYSGGLVLFQGADRKPDSPLISATDDLLFPSEIAKLPLEGTRLVTLSSCESGAGTPVSGEGVLGLRRGFSLAGASEVLVALWPVSDASTPRFMEQFYRRTLASNRPAQALWQTQIEHLSKPAEERDFEIAVLRYAPFVLSQSTPLSIGDPIPRAELSAPPSGSFDWRYLLAAIPLLAFMIARLSKTTTKSS